MLACGSRFSRAGSYSTSVRLGVLADDEFVGGCVLDKKSKTPSAGAPCTVAPCPVAPYRKMLTHSWAFKWLKQRLADELTMHILHAFGVLRWRT
jgi:hypothetical protein